MDDSQLPDLYNSLKHIVWVIELEKNKDVSHATGFCVSENGLIMTKARGLLGASVKVRKLYSEGGGKDGFIAAKVKKMDRKFNIAVLEVEGSGDDFVHRPFAVDGSLAEGESLLFLGNPGELVGSFLVGRNVFGCRKTDNECVVLVNDRHSRRLTCAKHDSNTTNVTPDYRIMGHIYNKEKYEEEQSERSEGDGSRFEKELHPFTPIIQCNGFGFGCMVASEGGPVFNKRGDIVGMLISIANGYHFAIHVSVLRAWLNKVQEEDNV